ncbi:MAG TPA: 50S ribosomal protein L3 N(5)-glutamine methyltransferase, partial [Opitutaceae bacterium]|nr:50S ribosomal protein L3 N(5)-glutamine methyltransferase [Opitutaceae bacterium]
SMGQIASVPRDEALYLILWSLKLALDSGSEVLARRLTAAESKAIEELFRRRLVEHVPAAYITGEAWLGGLRFHVDERVLIPRSYFVEILPTQVDPWLGAASKVRHVADVCTGSGCLAILLARHFKKAVVDGLDISEGALEVAKVNVKRHRLADRVRLVRSDLLKDAPAAKYDVILSNPPYEPTGHVDKLPEEFKREPRLALDGGADGLILVRKIIAQSAKLLKPKGVLMIEVGGCREAFDSEFARLKPHWFYSEDGSDCVCLIQAQRLQAPQSRARS